MELVIDQKAEPGIIVGTASGQLRLQDLKAAAAALWREVTAPEACVLWDLRGVNFELSSAEVAEFAAFGKQNSPFAGLRMAFLVSDDLAFGLIRMFDVFRATERTHTAVFRIRSQALAWLRQDAV